MKNKKPTLAERRAAAALLGRIGGQTTGPSKARTSEQARAAINVRWAKYRQAKEVR